MGLDLTTLAVAKSYTQKTLNGSGAIKGEKGDKGDPFTYEDFTPEQLELLKGQPGKDGIDGQNGLDGADGQDGITPHIGSNGNWYIGNLDTGINAEGKDGVDGSEGSNGLSAYEIAVNNGFIGTEQEWLESLKGKDGEPGEPANLPDIYSTEDIPPTEDIATEDKFLLGTQEGNRTVTADNFVKFVMDNINIPDIKSPVKVPLVKGYSVVVKDYDTVIAKNTRSVVLFNFSDLGLNIDDVVSIEVLTLQSTYTIALDHYINHETKDFYIIHYAGNNVSTPCTLTVRVCLLVKDSSVKEDSGRVGEVIAYMGTTAPLNYLACDGAEYNISDFPYLAQHFKTAFGSVNHFGGDGETTFAVPDLRGEFLRGTGGTASDTRGEGAEVGVHQDPTKLISFRTGTGGAVMPYNYSPSQANNNWDNKPTTNATTRNIALQSSGSGGIPYYVTARPTNTSVMWCIRYLDTVNGVSETTPLLKGIRAVTIPVDDYFVLNTDYCDIGNISDYGISAESIIGISYNLTVEKSRVAIVDVAVISSSGVIKARTNGNVTDKTSLEGNVTIFVKDFDVEDITLDDLPEATEVSSEDKFLIGVSGENKSITGENLLKSITENLDITPGEVMQVPFLYGYKILVKDFDVTISAGNSRCKVFNPTDIGLSLDDIISIDAFSKDGVTISLDHYFDHSANNDFYIVYYNGQNVSVNTLITVRIALVVKDDTLQLPYIYGYKLVTKEVELRYNNALTGSSISADEFGLSNFEDVLSVYALNMDDTTSVVFNPYIEHDTHNMKILANKNITGTFKILTTLIIKDTSTVPKEKEPRLRAITKTYTGLNMGTVGSFIVGNISDFGDIPKKDVAGIYVHFPDTDNIACETRIIQNGDIQIYRYDNHPVGNNITIEVTLTVKDYSDIGSEIVMENVKMITRSYPFTNMNSTASLFIDLTEFGENISPSDIVGCTAMSTDAAVTFIAGFNANRIQVSTSQSTKVTGIMNVSLFVRVPVVEQLPRFTKDVEVTLNGLSSVSTGIILNGSDEVGGYDLDNIHSVNCIVTKGIAKWLLSPVINFDEENEIRIAGIDNSQKGAITVRITIE